MTKNAKTNGYKTSRADSEIFPSVFARMSFPLSVQVQTLWNVDRYYCIRYLFCLTVVADIVMVDISIFPSIFPFILWRRRGYEQSKSRLHNCFPFNLFNCSTGNFAFEIHNHERKIYGFSISSSVVFFHEKFAAYSTDKNSEWFTLLISFSHACRKGNVQNTNNNQKRTLKVSFGSFNW